MVTEKLEVEGGFAREWVLYVGIEVDSEQSAAIVGAERDLTTGVGGDCTEAQIGIAIGYRFADDRIPEEYTGFGRLPSVVDDFAPEGTCIDLFLPLRFFGIDGVLLFIGFAFDNGTHEFIVDLHRYVGSRHLAFGHFGIDEGFGIRMLDGYGQHKCTATAVLSYFARTVGVAFHERNQAGGCEGGVLHGRTFRTNMGEVVPYASAAFHQLYLLFIDANDSSI